MPEPPPDEFGFAEFTSPFAALSPEQRVELAQAMARVAAEQFNESFTAIQAGLTDYESMSLLSYLSFYFLTFESDIDPPPSPYPRLFQHHVELLQALMLRHPRDAFPWMPTFPDSVGFLTRLDRASQAFSFQRLNLEGDEAQQQRLRVQEEIRRYTQGVRNWGYPDQIWRIVAGLFAPLDAQILERFGMRVEHLVAMCAGLIDLVGKRVHDHFERLDPVANGESIQEAIAAHERAFPDLAGTGAGLEQLLAVLRPDIGLEEVKEFLLSHLNLRLPDVYTLNRDDFLTAYPGPVDWDRLRAVVERWSLSFGDLADERPNYFFLRNPVWTRPLIRLDDEQIFCPIPWLLQSFCLELMESLIWDDDDLRRRYQDECRSEFLESEVERLFRQAFPAAQIFPGSMWSSAEDPTTIYENDLLVLLDSYLIIVEAKSGAVTDAALRGAPARLEGEVKKLLVEPSEQAHRFAQFLRQDPGPHRFPTKRGGVNEVDARSVKEIVCLGVTLDQLGRLYSHWPALRDAGLIDADANLVPTLALVDLESIFEILANQSERLHYLVRRGEFERNANYSGGELDLFTFYLKTGFNIGELEFDDAELMLTLESLELNPYLNRRITGDDPPRPKLRLTAWWRAIVERVEATRPPRWPELALVLLNASVEEQELFEERFQQTLTSVRDNWMQPGHEDVLYFGYGPEQRRQVLAGLVARRPLPDALEEVIAGVAGRAFEVVNAERGAIVVVDVLLPLYPYRAVAFIEPPSPE
jgi:hypothetical protein